MKRLIICCLFLFSGYASADKYEVNVIDDLPCNGLYNSIESVKSACKGVTVPNRWKYDWVITRISSDGGGHVYAEGNYLRRDGSTYGRIGSRTSKSCPEGETYINGKCGVPNYCDTSQAARDIQQELNACKNKAGENQRVVRNDVNCIHETESLQTFCEIEDIPEPEEPKPQEPNEPNGDDDTGNIGPINPNSGGGSGGSSGGSSGIHEPGTTVNTGGDDNNGNAGSGNSGNSGGSNAGSGATSGGGSGGSQTVIKEEIDVSGVISAINSHKNKMSSYLNTLQNNSAKDLQEWNDTQALLEKYYRTAESSHSSLEHMENFSQEELAVLKEMQGQYLTNFDMQYKQAGNLVAATNSLKNENKDGFNKVDASIKESMDKLNQVFADADKADKEKLDELKQANSDKLDEVKQANSDKLDEIKTTIENKTDEQTTALTKSIDGLGDKIDGLELDVDTSGIENKLTDVGSKLDDQNGMLAELGKGGQRNLGGCRTRGNCTSFVTSEYPNGLEGIMTSHFETLKNGAFIGVVNQFNMSFPAAAPSFEFCWDAIIDFGCREFKIPAAIWTFIRICIMFTAFMTCRKLVFGG